MVALRVSHVRDEKLSEEVIELPRPSDITHASFNQFAFEEAT